MDFCKINQSNNHLFIYAAFSKMALSNPIMRLLDKNNLTEPNYKDCLCKPKLVLGMEKILDVLEQHVLESLPEGHSKKEWVTWEEMRDQDLRARTYILASMTNELQHQHEHMTDARSMIANLQELYGEHSQMIRYEISKQLFKAKMIEGTDVGDHILKMINLVS